MAALVCDICGGKLTMSTGGIAVCGSCGMEHTKERMQEKVQEIKGVVQIDNTHMINNYLNIAENAYNSNNSKEAESYCNKVLEIDPVNYQAWFLKGKSAGWQSTINNPRFPEAVSAFSNAIKNAPEDIRDKVVDDAISQIKKLSEALLIVRSQRFVKWPDSDEQVGFVNDLTVILDTIFQFYTSIGILIDLDELHAPLAMIISKSVMDAWNNTIVPKFTNDNDGHPDDYELTRLIDRAGYCTSLLETAIKISSTDDDADIQRYKNLIAIHSYLISAHSY
ncbi:MAG: tetratricopeptide repeat protein, partial [Fastidiosipila sp.]|nr:tetratricopeptide repeat protein [Fastidiosipila sp.]